MKFMYATAIALIRVKYIFASVTMTPPKDVLTKGDAYKIAVLGDVGGNNDYSVISSLLFSLIVLGVLGCMLLVLFAIGKYVLNGNGEAKNELKTTICHKLMVIIGLASGLAFLNVIRKVAIALVAA